jgi:hypothetical protein
MLRGCQAPFRISYGQNRMNSETYDFMQNEIQDRHFRNAGRPLPALDGDTTARRETLRPADFLIRLDMVVSIRVHRICLSESTTR